MMFQARGALSPVLPRPQKNEDSQLSFPATIAIPIPIPILILIVIDTQPTHYEYKENCKENCLTPNKPE